MPCIVCNMPSRPACLYCPRCRHIADMAADDQLIVEIRAALTEAWDEHLKRFLCFYTNLPLEEKDRKNPMFLVFDHIIPGQKRLVACGSLPNFMKGDLTGDQFRIVIPELDDHFVSGRPFNRDIVRFPVPAHLQKPVIRRLAAPWEAPLWRVTDCVVCHDPLFPKSMYCARCRRFITVQRDNAARRVALINAWSELQRGFLCRYTGVKLEELDFRSPWYITFDHRIPGKAGDLVVAAAWVNRMKSFLTEQQFRAVVHEFARHFRDGTPFDSKVLDAVRLA
jgi:hypothetical protein